MLSAFIWTRKRNLTKLHCQKSDEPSEESCLNDVTPKSTSCDVYWYNQVILFIILWCRTHNRNHPNNVWVCEIQVKSMYIVSILRNSQFVHAGTILKVMLLYALYKLRNWPNLSEMVQTTKKCCHDAVKAQLCAIKCLF